MHTRCRSRSKRPGVHDPSGAHDCSDVGYGTPMSNPNQYGAQARGAAEGKAGGPQIGPNKGPTDRRDLAIAIGAIAAVAAIVLALAFG